MESFLAKVWSTRGDGVVTTPSGNVRAENFEDGSGILWHYHTVEAIRTRSGLVIANSECWARGRAWCARPREHEADAWLPLTTMARSIGRPAWSSEIRSQELLKGVRVVTEDHGSSGHVSMLVLDDGAIVVSRGRDFASYLSPEQAKGVGSALDALHRTMPSCVVTALGQGKRVPEREQWYFVPMPEGFEPRGAVTTYREAGETTALGKGLTPSTIAFDHSREELCDLIEAEVRRDKRHVDREAGIKRGSKFATKWKRFSPEQRQLITDARWKSIAALHPITPEAIQGLTGIYVCGRIYGEQTWSGRTKYGTSTYLGKQWHKAVKTALPKTYPDPDA